MSDTSHKPYRKGTISIVVPIYNADDYLEQCISSILTQTYINLEIILVNDGSTDNSEAICEKFVDQDSRIILINKKNEGVTIARNVGIRKATGEYLGFVDSDDYIEKDMYEVLEKYIRETKSDIAMCSYYYDADGNYSMVDQDKNDFEVSVYNNKEALAGIYGLLDNDKEKKISNKSRKKTLISNERSISSYVWCKLFKSNLVNPVDSKFTALEDELLCIEAFAHASKIVYVDVQKYYYRNLSSGLANMVNEFNTLGRIYVLEHYWSYISRMEKKYIEIAVNRVLWYFFLFYYHTIRLESGNLKNKQMRKMVEKDILNVYDADVHGIKDLYKVVCFLIKNMPNLFYRISQFSYVLVKKIKKH